MAYWFKDWACYQRIDGWHTGPTEVCCIKQELKTPHLSKVKCPLLLLLFMDGLNAKDIVHYVRVCVCVFVRGQIKLLLLLLKFALYTIEEISACSCTSVGVIHIPVNCIRSLHIKLIVWPAVGR